MKKGILIILVVLLFSSCQDDYDHTQYRGIAFSFYERVTIIEVDETVTSFKLCGIVDNILMPSANWNNGQVFSNNLASIILIDTIKSTAMENIHYVDKGIDNRFHKVENGSGVYAHIKLIPEKINKEVEIVFYSLKPYDRVYVNDEWINVIHTEFMINAIDTTIIRLVPKKGFLMEGV